MSTIYKARPTARKPRPRTLPIAVAAAAPALDVEDVALECPAWVSEEFEVEVLDDSETVLDAPVQTASKPDV